MSEARKPAVLGPFWLDVLGDLGPFNRVYREGEHGGPLFVLALNALMDPLERHELVTLLNKGTHYDALLEAAEGVIDISDYAHRPVRLEKQIERQSLCPVAEDRLNTLRAAIAACEGGEDG